MTYNYLGLGMMNLYFMYIYLLLLNTLEFFLLVLDGCFRIRSNILSIFKFNFVFVDNLENRPTMLTAVVQIINNFRLLLQSSVQYAQPILCSQSNI